MPKASSAWLLALLLCSCGSPQFTTPPRAAPPLPSAQASAGPVDELDRPLPLDARLKKGTLDNGLTYYILPHKKPENRAQIWLAVNAGAVLEDDDQRGLAHFVEHMGFNGTKRFPKQALVDFVEKSGVRFGPDLNAYTSFDETVYMLQVPTDKPDLLNRGLSVLRDWADGVSFDPGEVEKERGVVLEEWRLGRGAGMRLFDKQAPVFFHGSKYAERIVIGKPEIIKNASRDTLVRFYQDWYRPDLMAVVAVGDFTTADIEARIKSEFSSLKPPAKPRPRATVTLPAHDNTLVSIETDPEMPTTSVRIMSKLPARSEKSARDYRRMLSERLFNAMLNGRLDELRRLPDAPFLSAGSSSSMFLRHADVFQQSATVKDDGVERGFGALLEEVLRVERHGFTSSELDRARSQLLRQYQHAVAQRDKLDARSFASEIVRNFLREETMPGPEAELALAERFLPTFSLDEINQLSKTLGKGSRVIAVTGPSRMVKPTSDAMIAMSRDVASRDIKPYEDAAPSGPLMAQKPAPGPVVKTSTVSEINVTEWTLKNGVRVIVKPTTFSNDEVKLTAFSPGGTSLVKDADYDSAKFADEIVAMGGLGPFDAIKLRKSLAGKVASVSARISELEEGFSGHAAPADIELLLQMVNLSFTAPRRDENAFASWRTRETESVRNRRLSPDRTFFEDMLLFSTQNHLRRRPTTPEVLQKVDLDKVMAIYKDRFADAGDFTFVLVGNIELDRLKPLVETYLGSLPTKGRKESWRDINVAWPNGVQTKTIVKGTEPKSRVTLTFHGAERWTRDTDNDLRMLAEVLRIRLREILREDMGGVYGVTVGGAITRRPKQEFTFNVSFGCSPENVDKLEKAIFDEVKVVQEKGIGDDYIVKVKELRRRAHETDLKDNGYWTRELERAYRFGDDPRQIVDITPLLDKVNSDHVRAAAKKYITTKQYVLGVLKPENAGAAAP
ncbi:MAG: insulinase family protein [Deltaproteobacteria bacterium]|nr:insulinase family protein [Deltaproteobacteria bacterium]